MISGLTSSAIFLKRIKDSDRERRKGTKNERDNEIKRARDSKEDRKRETKRETERERKKKRRWNREHLLLEATSGLFWGSPQPPALPPRPQLTCGLAATLSTLSDHALPAEVTASAQRDRASAGDSGVLTEAGMSSLAVQRVGWHGTKGCRWGIKNPRSLTLGSEQCFGGASHEALAEH